MTERVLKIVEIDDECDEIYLDDKFIISANHDEHGWAGMNLAREMVLSLATIMNWKVVYE